MPYYYDGVRCDTLAELDALKAHRKPHTIASKPVEKPIMLTDAQALKIALGGEPKYPTRATHPEDSHDDERDYQEDLRRYAAAKEQIRNAVERGKRDPDAGYRHIPD